MSLGHCHKVLIPTFLIQPGVTWLIFILRPTVPTSNLISLLNNVVQICSWPLPNSYPQGCAVCILILVMVCLISEIVSKKSSSPLLPATVTRLFWNTALSPYSERLMVLHSRPFHPSKQISSFHCKRGTRSRLTLRLGQDYKFGYQHSENPDELKNKKNEGGEGQGKL